MIKNGSIRYPVSRRNYYFCNEKIKKENNGTWFECKVKYEKLTENGQQKAVTEPYLVDALSFTEAEARIIEEMTPFVTGGELKVTAVKRTNIAEIFWDEEGDKWYKVKVNFVTIDEKTAVEKKTAKFHDGTGCGFQESLRQLYGRNEGYDVRL